MIGKPKEVGSWVDNKLSLICLSTYPKVRAPLDVAFNVLVTKDDKMNKHTIKKFPNGFTKV